MEQMRTLTIGTTTFDIYDDEAVRFVSQELTDEQKAQARKNIGATTNCETAEKYFDITDDGLISLKPEYRGASYYDAATQPYGVSDKGKGVAGSLNAELPPQIIIPEVVNEIAVTELAPYMFGDNLAIEELTIPSFIETIPERFCEGTYNLHDVHGTFNVESVGKGAFQWSGVTKAFFPKLKELGTVVFNAAARLIVVDLGKNITTIPDRTFATCSKLSYVRNAGQVTTLGPRAFENTKRLKTLAFLPNLVSVGERGFRKSRVNYDWNSLNNCTFGTNSVYTQWNTTDFWSGCTYTECETPLKSTFSQRNPAWVNDTIGNTSRTYKNGCCICCAAMVYSCFENVELTSPKEFENIVEEINPSLMDLDSGYLDNLTLYLEAVGYTVENYSEYNATNLQKIYDALAAGAIVLTVSITTTENTGHMVLLHGINKNGEVLVCDTDDGSYNIGVYEANTFAAPIQNFVHSGNEFMIVRKPQN